MSADDPGPIRRGQRLAARWLDGLRRLILRAGKLAAEAPLELLTLDGRRWLRWARPRPILARLTSVNSTARSYSWAEVEEITPGVYRALEGGRTGSGNAWEANLAIDLPVGPSGGAVAELRSRHVANEYRFQWHRYGSKPTHGGGSGCPGPQVFQFFSYGNRCREPAGGTFTLMRPDTSVIGTCSPATIVPGIARCTIGYDEPQASTLSWTYDDAHGGSHSGSSLAGCGTFASVTIDPEPYPDELVLTMTGDDASNTIGAFLGVPITLTKISADDASAANFLYRSSVFGNAAGDIVCRFLVRKKFGASQVTFGTGFVVAWNNSAPEACAGGFPPLALNGQNFNASSAGGTISGPMCSPVNVTFAIISGPNAGIAGTITE